MKTSKRARWLIASSLLCAAGVALAEDVYVKMPVANILAGKGAGTDHIAQVKKGEKLQVVGHEGSWVKVKVGDKVGYVHENSVSASATSGDNGLGKLLAGASGSSSASSAEAGRGVGESLKYASSRGMSPAGLNRMIALRKTVTGSDWTQFTIEGHVGPEKK